MGNLSPVKRDLSANSEAWIGRFNVSWSVKWVILFISRETWFVRQPWNVILDIIYTWNENGVSLLFTYFTIYARTTHGEGGGGREGGVFNPSPLFSATSVGFPRGHLTFFSNISTHSRRRISNKSRTVAKFLVHLEQPFQGLSFSQICHHCRNILDVKAASCNATENLRFFVNRETDDFFFVKRDQYPPLPPSSKAWAMPRRFAQNRSISDPCEFNQNPHEQSRKQLETHFQACRTRFRQFGAISGTYQNPQPSPPQRRVNVPRAAPQPVIG